MGTKRAGQDTEVDGSFPLDLRAPLEARRLLVALAGAVSSGILTDLSLLLSEMVTNSLKHAGRAGRRVDVSIRAGPDAVRLEVRDAGPGFEPAPFITSPPAAGGGWGLFIVDHLASRWGTRPGGVVWAEMDYPAGGTPQGG